MNLDDWNKRIEAIKEALDVMITRNEQTIECLKQCRHLLKGEHYISVVVDNEEDWTFTFVDAGNGVKKMAVF